jgi:urease subunit gamma
MTAVFREIARSLETLQSLREVGSSEVHSGLETNGISAILGGYNQIIPVCDTLLWRYRCRTRPSVNTCDVATDASLDALTNQRSNGSAGGIAWRRGMQLTPREFDKLLIYMVAEVALKRKAKGLKLNHPEAVAIISAAALDGARAGKTIEDVAREARQVLTKDDVMDGVADLIPMVQVEAVFTDGSRLVTVHMPIQ